MGLLEKVLKMNLLRVRWKFFFPEVLIRKNGPALCFRKLPFFPPSKQKTVRKSFKKISRSDILHFTQFIVLEIYLLVTKGAG